MSSRITRRIGAIVALGVAGLVLAGATGWGALALYYLAPGSEGVRTTLAWSFAALGLVTVAGLAVRRLRWWAALGFAAAFGLVLVVWGSTTPSNDRDWAPEVAVLPYATIDGERVTVHNIRNFDYRTETDFTPAYYDRTFDLKRLDRVDLVAVYWMGPAIAHLFLTFGFGDDHLAISIEVRKNRTKPYATLPGIFRQYELVYVVADERDVIRVRTNYRKDPPEEVYLFRVVGDLANGRRVFLDYMRDLNALREHPRFYNTLTTNCTTMILAHAAVNPGSIPYSWKVLLSGYAPEYAYDMGRLDRSLPFDELKRRVHINAAAQAADKAPDFSQRIRAGVP
jgi:hypothetical protein